jgi:hypothetical protein
MRQNMEIISWLLAALCLVIIGIRRRRIFAGMDSPKMNEKIDIVDKVLALLCLIFALVSILSFVLRY